MRGAICCRSGSAFISVGLGVLSSFWFMSCYQPSGRGHSSPPPLSASLSLSLIHIVDDDIAKSNSLDWTVY